MRGWKDTSQPCGVDVLRLGWMQMRISPTIREEDHVQRRRYQEPWLPSDNITVPLKAASFSNRSQMHSPVITQNAQKENDTAQSLVSTVELS